MAIIDSSDYLKYMDEHGDIIAPKKEKNTISDIQATISNIKLSDKGDEVSTGANKIYGGNGNDTIHVVTGTKFVDAGKGNDLINIGVENSKIYAGAGNDTIYINNTNEYINAGSGRDVIYGYNLDDKDNAYATINGGKGESLVVIGKNSAVREHYVIENGDGKDYILYEGGNFFDDIQNIYKNGDDLVIKFKSSSAEYTGDLTLKDYFKLGSKFSIKNIISSDDSVIEAFEKGSKAFNDAIKNVNQISIDKLLKNGSIDGHWVKYEESGYLSEEIKTSGYDNDINIRFPKFIYLDATKGYTDAEISTLGKGYIKIEGEKSYLEFTYGNIAGDYLAESKKDLYALAVDEDTVANIKADLNNVERVLLSGSGDADVKISNLKDDLMIDGEGTKNVSIGKLGTGGITINKGEKVYLNTGSTNDKIVVSNLKYGEINTGAGNDTIELGDGNTFADVNTGAGNDFIDARMCNNSDYRINGGKGTNIVRINSSVNKSADYYIENGGGTDYVWVNSTSKFEYNKDGDDLVIVIKSNNTKSHLIHITDYFKLGNKHSFKGFVTDNGIQEITNKDGSISYKVINYEKITDLLEKTGKIDSLNYENYKTIINGTDYNDVVNLRGKNGNYIINAGKGTDTIYSSNGDDTIYMGSNRTICYLEHGSNTVYTENATNSVIYLTSDNGRQKIHLGKGDVKISWGEATTTNLVYYKDGNDLIIKIAGKDNKSLTLVDYYKTKYSNVYINDKITADVIKENSINAIKGLNISKKDGVITGSDGYDTLTGSDSIYCGKGDDKIYTNGKNSTVFLESGNNTIYAGSELTTITATKSSQGSDTVYIKKGKAEYLVKGNSVSPDAVPTSYNRVGNDAVINYENGSVTVKDYFKTKKSQNELKFSCVYKDSASDNLSGHDIREEVFSIEADKYLKNKISLKDDYTYSIIGGNAGDNITIAGYNSEVLGGDGNDVITATGKNIGKITLNGGKGNDTITGAAGANNIIKGGDGDDVLKGGSNGAINSFDSGFGDDVIYTGKNSENNFEYEYQWNGNDTIYAKSVEKNDKYTFNLQQSSSLISAKVNGNDLILVHTDTNETITLKDWLKDTSRLNKTIINCTDGEFDILTLLGNREYYENKSCNEFKKNKIKGTFLNEIITGGYLSDYIDGGDGNDSIDAGLGNNTIYGGAGNDTITVLSGNNKIYGGSGNDVINIAGNEYYNSEFSKSGNNTIDAGSGDDNIYIHDEGKNVVKTGTGIDNVTIFGNGNNKIYLEGTADDVNGLYIGTKADENYGNGDNTITGTKGQNEIYIYGNGNNKILLEKSVSQNTVKICGNGDNLVKTGKEIDVIYLENAKGNNTIKAGKGDDYINASFSDCTGNNYFYGEDGNDLIYGGKGNDYISGGNGNDELHNGGKGVNILDGGTGDDKLYVDVPLDDTLGMNYLYGGAGNDVYEISSLNQYTYIYDSKGSNDVLNITDSSNSNIIFDVKVDKKGKLVKSYGKDIYIVSKDNFDKSFSGTIDFTDKTSLTDKIEIKEQFGKGRIENINSIDYSKIDEIRETVAGWLASKGYTSVSQAIEEKAADLNELIAIFDNNLSFK